MFGNFFEVWHAYICNLFHKIGQETIFDMILNQPVLCLLARSLNVSRNKYRVFDSNKGELHESGSQATIE